MKDFEVEEFILKKHFPMICKWWDSYNQSELSPNLFFTKGLILMESGLPIAASWIYETNTSSCQVGWTIVNPQLGPKKKLFALNRILDHIISLAQSMGYEFIQSFSNKSALTKLMQRKGFQLLQPHDFLIMRNNEFESESRNKAFTTRRRLSGDC